MKLRKKFAVGMLLAGLVFTGCSNGNENESKKEASEVVNLGNSAPLTGPLSIYGTTTNNGIKLAIEEVNANGGILDKNVQWFEYDLSLIHI